jgi:hypothetical protein
MLIAGGIVLIPAVWILGSDVITRIYGINGKSVTPTMTVLLVGTWISFGLAGWYRFLMLLDANKWRSLVWSVLQAAWILVAGLLVASSGPTAMAAVIATSQVILAFAATAWLLRSTPHD